MTKALAGVESSKSAETAAFDRFRISKFRAKETSDMVRK
jgi:hypothetical protein